MSRPGEAGSGTTVRHTGFKLKQRSITQFKPKPKTRLRPEEENAARQRALLIGGGLFALVTFAALGLYLVLRPSATVPHSDAPVLADQAPPLTNSETQPPVRVEEPETSHVASGLAPPADIGKLALGTQPAADISTLLEQADPARRQKISAVTQYINQYEGGDCFFVKPVQVAESGAVLEGYGASTAPFQVLDDAFRRTQGFEADIGVRQVATGQCPVVGFLGRLRAHTATAPHLDLASATLKSGQPLSGTLTGLDGRQADLLLVADDGSVRTVPATGEDKLSFSLRPGPEFADGKPQFLLAIASNKPVAALQGRQARQCRQALSANSGGGRKGQPAALGQREIVQG